MPTAPAGFTVDPGGFIVRETPGPPPVDLGWLTRPLRPGWATAPITGAPNSLFDPSGEAAASAAPAVEAAVPPRAAAPPLKPAPVAPEQAAPGFTVGPDGRVFEPGGRPVPRPEDLDARLPGSRAWPEGSLGGGMDVFVDTSRGTAGREWADEHRQALPSTINSPDLYGPGGANLTQADYEGRANMRRMLDAAYPTHEAFDPLAARIEDATEQGDLALAELRAADPVAFAKLQAGIPEQAKMAARFAAAGVPEGDSLYGVLGAWENKVAMLEGELAKRRATPEYKAATPEAREMAEGPVRAEIDRLKGHMRIMQQAMGFATGQTPGSLYGVQPY